MNRLPTAGRVRLAFYDVQGRQVREPSNGWKPAGLHHVRMDAERMRNLPGAGALFARLEMEGRTPVSVRVTRIR